VTPAELAAIRRRYEGVFGPEGVEPAECDAIEAALGIRLPDDLRSIASFYSGGLLGGISHHAIASHGPPDNVVDETLRLREAAGLPRDLIVLAEPPGGLIVLNAGSASAVVWCSDFDVPRLSDLTSLTKPDIWRDYYSFFRHLLELEEEERREITPAEA
jgi:hypothetical protein